MTTMTRARTESPGRAAPQSGPFVGTWPMLRFALRRDRVLLPAWVLGFSAMVSFSVAATKDLYPTLVSRAEAADTINATAALVALYGKVYDPTSLGALSLIKMTAFGAALVALVFIFLVIRHSRSEEETGRLELLASGVVGRGAPLAAALLVALIGSVALGVLTSLGLAAVGLPWVGSVAFGLSWALSGIVFGAVAGVTAQVTTSPRPAIGLGTAAVAIAYALRAVGDLADWRPGLAVVAVADRLEPADPAVRRRPLVGLGDPAAGHRAPGARSPSCCGPGATSAPASSPTGSARRPAGCGTAEGLAWRLQRGMLVAWIAGAAVMGFVLGSVAHNVTGLLGSQQMRAVPGPARWGAGL